MKVNKGYEWIIPREKTSMVNIIMDVYYNTILVSLILKFRCLGWGKELDGLLWPWR